MDIEARFGILLVMNKSSITVINNKNLRGFVAPSSVVSEETLEDVIDLVRYSDPKVIAKINREFNKTKKFIDGPTFRKELGV